LKSVSKYSVSNEIEVCGIIQPKYDGANNNTFKNYFFVADQMWPLENWTKNI